MAMQAARARVLGRSLASSRPCALPRFQPSRLRQQSTATGAEAGASGPPPPPPAGKVSAWRRFLQTTGGITLVTAAGGVAFYYFAQKDKTPGAQLPHDPSKKTLVICGSGWGATSLLNSLDTLDYNVILISPRNYFLFTPLLPSVAVGTLAPRSILQPTRYVTRHKQRQVTVIEGSATDVDVITKAFVGGGLGQAGQLNKCFAEPVKKTVTFADTSEAHGAVKTIPYDYLVFAVGAEVQTFNIPGVREHACFMKELEDAENMQRRFMNCMESAAFPDQSTDEIKRLLHMVVVGGGPTGVELSGELHDFLEEDLRSWYPELAEHVRITLVEALPNVLPMFSKRLIDYTESTFKEAKIDILTRTMVKEIKEKSVVLQMPDKSIVDVPCGIVVWAAGNTLRKVTRDLMAKFPKAQENRRGITVDECLRMAGTDGSVFALGDCTATPYAPTAQVASQEGAYLARVLAQIAKRDALQQRIEDLAASPEADKQELKQSQQRLAKLSKLRPFKYSHQGSLAYIGSEKAIADLPIFNGNIATGGVATFLFWRSAYLSTLFSMRNRTLVAADWLKVKFFGRDVTRGE